MSEKDVTIKVDDGVIIYGTLRGELTQPLVIFVHGLTGHRNEHIFYNGARFFEKHDFASFRYDQYGSPLDTRKLTTMTIAQQSADLAKVIAHFKKEGVEKVNVVGHSYGGPTILMLKDPPVDAVVLWDPTYEAKSFFDNPDDPEAGVYNEKLDTWIVSWNADILIGKEMVTEGKDLDSLKLIKNLHKPVKIITCQEGSEHYWPGITERWLAAANEAKSAVMLPGADHNFNTGETEQDLFKETLIWLNKYS